MLATVPCQVERVQEGLTHVNRQGLPWGVWSAPRMGG